MSVSCCVRNMLGQWDVGPDPTQLMVWRVSVEDTVQRGKSPVEYIC